MYHIWYNICTSFVMVLDNHDKASTKYVLEFKNVGTIMSIKLHNLYSQITINFNNEELSEEQGERFLKIYKGDGEKV